MRDKADQIRAIAGEICRFANGGCLCLERDKPLCRNVMLKAQAIYEICHPTEKPKVSAVPKRKR